LKPQEFPMPKRLTVEMVRRLQSDGVEREIADARQPGLVLRVGRRSASFRYQWSVGPAGRQRKTRLVLGDAAELTLDDARVLARKAADLVTQGMIPDAGWVRFERVPVDKPAVVSLDVSTSRWTFAEARSAFLAHIKANRKAGTFRDYSDYLNRPELGRLEHRPVDQITEEGLSMVCAVIHSSGREGTAEGLKRKLSSMWTFLQRQHNREKSGVRKRIQLDVPDRTPGKRRPRRFPLPSEVRAVLRKARAGEYGIASAPHILLCLTGQRRGAVAAVSTDDVRDGIWHIPPLHRKTAAMRDDTRVHTLPWPDELEMPPWGEWVFKAKRKRIGKGAAPHVAGSTLTHALKDEAWSSHDVRRTNDYGIAPQAFQEGTDRAHPRSQ
jgi:integrase